MQNTEPTLWQRRWSVFRWYLSQFSTVLHVILHTPFAAVAATALKNLVRFDAKHWANVVTTSVERFSLISQSILNRFTCNFAHTIRSRCGDCPEKFGEVWSSIPKVINVMHWNNTVSTSPERWKCGPSLKQHWGSALPPSYMCDWAVRTDKAGRQDWESNYQHYIDIGLISFFFFFFFKIWYLAENKREKIAFAKYPLLREM